MRNRNLTMGEMAQFMAEQQGFNTAEFARKRRGKRRFSLPGGSRRKKSGSRLRTAAKIGALAGLGAGVYAGATKTKRGQAMTSAVSGRLSNLGTKVRSRFPRKPSPSGRGGRNRS